MREEGGERAGPQAQAGVKADPVFPTDCNGKWSRSQVRLSRSTPGSYTMFNIYIKWMCVCIYMSAHVRVCTLSNVQLFANPWTAAHQAPLSMGFPRKNTGVGCRFLLQGIFPTPASNSHLFCLLHWREDSLPTLPPGKLMLCLCISLFILKFYTWPTIG